MSTLDAFTKIRDHLTTMWTTTPLSWDNEAFTTPADASGNDLPFVHVQIIGDLFDQASIGAGNRLANRWEEEGDLLLTVIVPEGIGSVLARTYASALAEIYRGLQLADIEFRDISIGLGVAAEDRGAWWALPVRINWIKG
ncbi:phage tail terminator-like protein [Sediminicoccus sp. KRV36]|uniref:phage tail terminator-like protein n=1 Tax=Sediminicoccus sp. KRV36 TaxID=3133721 RepID=UPI00200F0186|nr:phage tail terminator-like protein [Sediminicoccus rosea]UPY35499.1 DUF4128 domain-containing protein [Sediminicoccus rosea]